MRCPRLCRRIPLRLDIQWHHMQATAPGAADVGIHQRLGATGEGDFAACHVIQCILVM